MKDLYYYQLSPQNPQGWEKLRKLRNECASFMTGFRGEITPAMQDKFREDFDPQVQQVWLAADETGWEVGFIYIHGADVTYGLTEEWRDLGYGGRLVEMSKNLSGGVLGLKVLRSNERAIRLYKHCGFVPVDSDEETLSMEWYRR